MTKIRPAPPPQREATAAPSRRGNGRLPLAVRVVISLIIVWHFAGIFLAAHSIGPTSELVLNAAQSPPMQWYLDALFLNQGHSFFAPSVGPGHLIRYEFFDQNGRPIGQGELPNLKEYRPRLRYHRYLMLADQADLPSPDKKVSEAWQRKYLEAYARQLLLTNEEAQSVRVRRYAHWPLPRDFAVAGRKLTDPEGYEMLMEVTQRRSDLRPLPGEQASAWQGDRQMAPMPKMTADPWRGVTR